MKPLKLFWRFARLAGPHWDKILLSIIIENAVQLSLLLPPLVLRVVFDYAYPNRDVRLLIIFVSIPFILTVILNLLMVMRVFIEISINQSVFYELYRIFYSKIQRLPIRFFHEKQTGDLIYRMTTDIQEVQKTILTIIPSLISAVIKLIVLLAICFSINKTVTLFALLGVPIHFWQTYLFSHKLKRVNQEKKEMNSTIYNLLDERLSNIKLIKLFHRWSEEVQLFLRQVKSLFFIERKARLTFSFHQLISTLINRFWALLLGIYTGYSVINGTLTIGEVVAITTYITMLIGPFDMINRLYRQYVLAQVSFERVTDILDQSVECPEDEEIGIDKKLKGNIAFENVSFGYKKGMPPIIKNISFDIKTGESMAIIGKSGIGKSSIIDLLLRFYSVTGGKILLDGIEINALTIETIRKQISLITHHSTLFYGTIRDNIVFGFQENDYTDKDVIKAAQKADAHEFITAFPNGYDTEVGPNGVRLSTGQQQRIAIARALLNDPKIIIFDEATSVLDSDSERQIHRAISKLKGEKTVIIIAHRLASIKYVDNILVLGNDGTIAEQGPVMTLMKQSSIFHRLYESEIGGLQHFIQQLQMYLKSVKQHQRPLSIGHIRLTNYWQLHEKQDEYPLSYLIDDMNIAISRYLRETDFFVYHSDGRFLVAYPETSKEDAQAIQASLIEKLTTFFTASTHYHIDLTYENRIIDCQPTDDITSISRQLGKDF